MAKFDFPLEAVLRQRKLVEEQKQRSLAAVQAEMGALEAELRSMDATVLESLADLRDNRLVGKLDLSFLAAHRRYSLAMQRRALGLAERMAATKLRLDDARRALGEAARDRKMMEKLRERRKEAWASELARNETAQLDEVGIQIAARAAGRAADDESDRPEAAT